MNKAMAIIIQKRHRSDIVQPRRSHLDRTGACCGDKARPPVQANHLYGVRQFLRRASHLGAAWGQTRIDHGPTQIGGNRVISTPVKEPIREGRRIELSVAQPDRKRFGQWSKGSVLKLSLGLHSLPRR
jgi:hypothetical protein